jgi:hypothetical protein
VFISVCISNPHAKRLYDDLLHNYNRLIRPVQNFTETLTVNLGLKLSQLIDVVSIQYARCSTSHRDMQCRRNNGIAFTIASLPHNFLY